MTTRVVITIKLEVSEGRGHMNFNKAMLSVIYKSYNREIYGFGAL
jgi:hypothetical protein